MLASVRTLGLLERSSYSTISVGKELQLILTTERRRVQLFDLYGRSRDISIESLAHRDDLVSCAVSPDGSVLFVSTRSRGIIKAPLDPSGELQHGKHQCLVSAEEAMHCWFMCSMVATGKAGHLGGQHAESCQRHACT